MDCECGLRALLCLVVEAEEGRGDDGDPQGSGGIDGSSASTSGTMVAVDTWDDGDGSKRK
jgi:hypothetical protein